MRRLALLPCLGVLLAAGSAVGLASDARFTENRVAFQDARGEEPDGPDITSVVVSNGDAGLITFRIDIPTHPVLTDDMRIRVWVDSDHDLATGLSPPDASPTGWDYFLLWERGAGREDPSLFRCKVTTCTGGSAGDPPQRTLRFSYAGGPTLSILDAELGDTKRLRFSVEVAAGIVRDPATGRLDFTSFRRDSAPEPGRSWSYDVRGASQRLLVRSFATAPLTPRAGATFAVRLAASKSPSRALLSSGRVRCTATVGRKPLRPRSQAFAGKRATCVFAIPSDAAGKTIRGTIAIHLDGKKLIKAFARRIRP